MLLSASSSAQSLILSVKLASTSMSPPVACRKIFEWGRGVVTKIYRQATKCPRITDKRWSITDKR